MKSNKWAVILALLILISLIVLSSVLLSRLFNPVIQRNRLFTALYNSDVAGVSAALSNGADPNGYRRSVVLFPALIGSNPTPLIEACIHDHAMEMVELLLEAGADPQKEDMLTGVTAISVARAMGEDELVQLMINQGTVP